MGRMQFFQASWRTGGVLLLSTAPGLLIFSGCESRTGRGSPDLSADAPAAVATEKASIEMRDADTPAGGLADEMTGEAVSVVGEVVQQCPASGCWFMVESESGETFINLIPSGIRLSKDHVGQRARISGKVVQRGSELAVEASEVEFAPSGTDSAEGEQ